jgi:hypothetical protein
MREVTFDQPTVRELLASLSQQEIHLETNEWGSECTVVLARMVGAVDEAMSEHLNLTNQDE